MIKMRVKWNSTSADPCLSIQLMYTVFSEIVWARLKPGSRESKVLIGQYLCDSFPIENGVEEEEEVY
jgi:hypothetical protein